MGEGSINKAFLGARRVEIVRNAALWRTWGSGEYLVVNIKQTSHVRETVRWYDQAMTSYAITPAAAENLVDALHTALPDLQAVYLFGSQASGDAGPERDIDLAVLTDAPRDSVTLWELAGDLALLCGLHVDLLDLRAANTVMQYQVITSGKRIWTRGSSAALYESFILSEKTRLDEARDGLLEDIAARGTVYG